MKPLVTVITPTWQRHDVLSQRCIPSVIFQDYKGPIEHLIISDGPDPHINDLSTRAYLSIRERDHAFGPQIPDHDRVVRNLELGRNWKAFTGDSRSFGTIPRIVGCYLAKGEYIAYLDDDDEWFPSHLSKVIHAMEQINADFAYSKMLNLTSKGELIGVMCEEPPREAYIGTSAIVHHIRALSVANWEASGYGAEWHLIEKWLNAGMKYVFVNEITVKYWRYPGG